MSDTTNTIDINNTTDMSDNMDTYDMFLSIMSEEVMSDQDTNVDVKESSHLLAIEDAE